MTPSPEPLNVDKEGFLIHLSDWNESAALILAKADSIELSEQHWEIIRLVRKFYQTFNHSPEMRPLVKFIKQELGEDKGNSLYLLSLFSDSPAKRACKISGLPKPANCL